LKIISRYIRKKNRTIIWLFVIVSCFNISAFIVPETLEEIEQQVLFKIERSKDPDEIWYTINVDQNGILNEKIPVKAFWVKKTENNKIEPLTPIQNRFAYGIKPLDSGNALDNEWHFQLAAYKNRLFILKRSPDNLYKVFTLSRNKEIVVERLYVEFDGGSFLSPKISHVELRGIDLKTDRKITETIYSGK